MSSLVLETFPVGRGQSFREIMVDGESRRIPAFRCRGGSRLSYALLGSCLCDVAQEHP